MRLQCIVSSHRHRWTPESTGLQLDSSIFPWWCSQIGCRTGMGNTLGMACASKFYVPGIRLVGNRIAIHCGDSNHTLCTEYLHAILYYGISSNPTWLIFNFGSNKNFDFALTQDMNEWIDLNVYNCVYAYSIFTIHICTLWQLAVNCLCLLLFFRARCAVNVLTFRFRISLITTFAVLLHRESRIEQQEECWKW